MSNTQMLAALVAAFIPFVLAMILRKHWSESTKSSIAFFVCVIAGLATCYVTGQLTTDDADQITSSILIVLVTALALYHGFWKPSGIASAVNITAPTMPFRLVRTTPPTDADTTDPASATPAEPQPPAAPLAS